MLTLMIQLMMIFFLNSGVGICGLNKITKIAQDMIAEIDNCTERFERAKKDWTFFGETIRGVIEAKEQKLSE